MHSSHGLVPRFAHFKTRGRAIKHGPSPLNKGLNVLCVIYFFRAQRFSDNVWNTGPPNKMERLILYESSYFFDHL